MWNIKQSIWLCGVQGRRKTISEIYDLKLSWFWNQTSSCRLSKEAGWKKIPGMRELLRFCGWRPALSLLSMLETRGINSQKTVRGKGSHRIEQKTCTCNLNVFYWFWFSSSSASSSSSFLFFSFLPPPPPPPPLVVVVPGWEKRRKVNSWNGNDRSNYLYDQLKTGDDRSSYVYDQLKTGDDRNSYVYDQLKTGDDRNS